MSSLSPETAPFGLIEAAIAILSAIVGSIVSASGFVFLTRFKLKNHGDRLEAAEKKIDAISLVLAAQPTREEVFGRIDRLEDSMDKNHADLGRRFDAWFAHERTGRASRP